MSNNEIDKQIERLQQEQIKLTKELFAGLDAINKKHSENVEKIHAEFMVNLERELNY